VLTSRESLAFDVMVPGYAFAHFAGPVTDVTLRLQPQPAVAVQVDGLGELPEACRATLFAKDVDWLLARTDERASSPPDWLNWFRGDVCRGTANITPCRPCRLRCQLLLSRQGARGIEMLQLGEASWEPGQDRIALSLDADALRAALDRLR
jgi:hypothetical protein